LCAQQLRSGIENMASDDEAVGSQQNEEVAEQVGTQPKAFTEEQVEELAKYDLTSKMTPFLDRHLIFPIFHFLEELGIYNPTHMTRAMLNLLADTKMIDFAVDKYQTLGEEVPESLNEKREEVLLQLSDSRERLMPLLKILEDQERFQKVSTFKSLNELCDEFGLEPAILDDLVHYTKLQFDCGNYSMGCELLKHYRTMMSVEESSKTSEILSCYWGSLSLFILTGEHDDASDILKQMDTFFEDASKMSKREILLQRTWLLHWTLWCIFKADKVNPAVVDLFLSEKSLSIISLSCPHLFRYVGACLILHKRLKNIVRDTVWIVHHEAGSYADPITRLLLALYTDVDFDEAQRELQKCATVCQGDFFLAQHWPEFEENARLLIFETYCRIHQCINIRMIATKLNMEAEEAELWIVKLIQNAKLDARIDSEKSRVVMSKAPPSVYQQVIEKTKNLSFRSTMLLSNLEKKDKERLN